MLSDDVECDPCLVVMVTGLDGDSISGVLDVTDSPRLGPVVLRQPGPIRGEYCNVLTNHSSVSHNTRPLDQSEVSIVAC